jgi:hypothetical protein
LDLGYADLAFRIAFTALEIWKSEVGESYNCFEHFIVASRRGTGWHNFGGLCTPVLNWFRAYHQPGTLTCGYETWVESLEVDAAAESLRAKLVRREENERPWVALVVLAPGKKYVVEWNGEVVIPTERYAGSLELRLSGSGVLRIA